MDETTRLAQLQRHWEFGTDVEIAHEIYDPAAILEFPQSGERFVGLASFKAWRSMYPAGVRFKLRRIRGTGDLWVAETSVSYDGGPWHFGVSILEFRGEKAVRETIYVTEAWQAPQWRARFRVERPSGVARS
jgi:hypothetical protein